MDGKRICRLVDRRYPLLDQHLSSNLRNVPWDLIPFSFIDLRKSIHVVLCHPPLPPCERFPIMHHSLNTLSTLKSEYDAVLKLARDRGVALTRHPDVEKLVEGDVEDLEFLEALISRIRENVLMVPPPRGRR